MLWKTPERRVFYICFRDPYEREYEQEIEWVEGETTPTHALICLAKEPTDPSNCSIVSPFVKYSTVAPE